MIYWYRYCLNNPLIYTDPTGEKWWHWALAAVGLGIIPPGTAESYAATFGAKTANSALIGFFDGIPDGLDKALEESWRRTGNSWEISMGLFQVDDTQGSGFNQFMQVISRHSWQQPMTIIGYEVANFMNNTRKVEVENFHGATVVLDPGFGGGLSIGGYITFDPSEGPLDYENTLLLHEYGHFLQTRQWGGLAFLPGGVTSLLSAGPDWRSTETHQEIWIEQDANARTLHHFSEILTSTQKANFKTDFQYQQFYDGKFMRYIFLFDPFYFIDDILWSK